MKGLFSIGLSLVAALTTAVVVGQFTAIPREGLFMTGIFVLAAMLWVTEALPLFATSLLLIGLQIVLLANPGNWAGLGFAAGTSPSYRQILGVAADPVLLLFFGGFALAQAAVKTGVDRSVSGLLLRPFGTHPRWVLLGIMTTTATFGMWMSNTAVTAVMLAFVGPLLGGVSHGDPFRKAVILGVPLAANLSGMATPISSPPNAVAIGFLQKAGYSVGFLEWMLVALPLVIVLMVVGWLVLWKFYAPNTPGLRLTTPREKLVGRGWVVVATFAITVLLWVSEGWHGLPPAIVAILPIVVLSAARIFTREDLKQIEWNVLILIAGGISLGAGLQLTGLDATVAQSLATSGENPFVVLGILVFGTCLVGTFMSNTAAANLFLPIGISSAVASMMTLAPTQAAVSIALAASMSMALPVSTPPNAMAYASGEFLARDMRRVFLPMSGLAIVMIILLGGVLMRWVGLLP